MRGSMRLTVVCCILFLLGGMLAGCATSGTDGAQSDSGGANTAATGSPDAAKPSAAKPLEVTMLRYERPSQPVKADSVAIQEILKRQNIKIDMESAPMTNYDDKKKTLIATNTMPDIMLVKQDDVQNYADSGVFLDLTPYLAKGDMPNLQKYLKDQPEINKNKLDGKLYGFPLIDIVQYATYGGQLPMIRMDLLDKLHLKPPTTFDELYQVLKQFKAAYPDSFPFATRAANGLSGTENLLNPIAFAYGSGYTTYTGSKVYYDPAAKKYAFGPDSPQFKQAVAWLHQLYKDKILDPDYATANSQIWQQALSSGKSAFFYDNEGYGQGFTTTLQATNPQAKFDMLPTLAAPNGTKRNLVYPIGHLSESWVIRGNVKNPEQIVKFMDWFYSDEGAMLTNWGIEGEHYTLDANKNPNFTAAFRSKYNPTAPNPAQWFSDLGVGFQQLGLVSDSRAGVSFNGGETNPWVGIIAEDVKKGLDDPFVNDPPFNKDEREQLKRIRSQIDSYLTANMDKFIIEDGALDKDWNGFVQALKDKGSEQMVKIYNDALARVK